MSVVIVSLYPLDTTGGGELYTIETAQAVRAAGVRSLIAAPVEIPPLQANLATRLRTPFIWADAGADTDAELLTWADVLLRLAEHDHVWVHQYLAADLAFDLIAATASDQELLFTSLGFEPARRLFTDIYQPCPRHHFVEISAYAASRASTYAPAATWVRAGIWCKELTTTRLVPSTRTYTALGRVLPHKGLETTIDALAPDDRLDIVGPQPDDAYLGFLRERSRDKDVVFHGCLPRADVQRLLTRTSGLISASTHVLFDGRRIEQPELLGLVLCEALRDGTLPITSDVPAFVEVMTALGLADWTFTERNPAALRNRLDRLNMLDQGERQEKLTHAREALRREFAWDDYWPRVIDRIGDRTACA